MSLGKTNEPAEVQDIVGVVAVLAAQNLNGHLLSVTIARVGVEVMARGNNHQMAIKGVSRINVVPKYTPFTQHLSTLGPAATRIRVACDVTLTNLGIFATAPTLLAIRCARQTFCTARG